MFSTLLLAIAVIALSVAVLVLERRVSALEKPCFVSIDDLKRANRLQSYFEDIRDNTPKFFSKVNETFSRPCAEDENPE